MMADEVTGSVRNGNGERLELRVGSKSLGLTTRDLIPILLILCALASLYVIRVNLREWLKSLETQQTRIEQGMHENREVIMREVSGWRLVVEQQTAQIRRMLEIQQANTHRDPSEWLPLEFPPASLPPPTRER